MCSVNERQQAPFTVPEVLNVDGDVIEIECAPAHALVWVVGPDMCGKTQISRELARRIGASYFKASSEHGTLVRSPAEFSAQTRYCEPRQIDMIVQLGARVVLDRGWPCEHAYGTVLGRAVDAQSLVEIDRLSSRAGGIVVCCWRTSYDGIVDDIDARLAGATLQRIELEYRRLAATCRTPFVFVNVDDEDLDREVSEIITAIGRINVENDRRCS